MKTIVILLLLGTAACGQTNRRSGQATPKVPPATSVAAVQSMISGKSPVEMKLIPIPTDKAQLKRLLAAGYTIHKDHMHPPGVKSCPFDKSGGGVVE